METIKVMIRKIVAKMSEILA